MRSVGIAHTAQILFALALIGVLGGCATVGEGHPDRHIGLVKPFEVASASSLSGILAHKFANLARIDPDHPMAEGVNQTLSMFGREDLIAATSNDYKSNHCAPLSPTPNVLDEIVSRARDTSIVVINESHERSEYRGFIAEVASLLRPLGYDTLAIETLSNSLPDTPEQYLPAFRRQPDLPYFTDKDGYYLSEAGFGRLGRRVKTLGYHLLAYEIILDGPSSPGVTREQEIADREEAQASSLASFLRERPGAKLLVHVGYSHATEVPRPDGEKWMAARLKEKTGIDPLTISQTTCRGGGDAVRLSALPASEPAGTFDLVVDHPDGRFAQGRPEWRMLAGDIPVTIPQALRPTIGWSVIEARPVGEAVDAVPMDRVAIRPGENIALMLPPGRYYLRGVDVRGTEQARPKPAS